MIQLSGIDRIFQVGDETVFALKSVSLSVRTGEYIAVMGPSGSGKSTLLNIIGLLDRPTKGTYHLENIDTTDLNDNEQAMVRRNKIGFVFQFFHLVPRLTAAGNIELPLMLAGIDTHERKKRVTEALTSLGLSDRANHRPDQLSGGQRQRVAIARATVMRPKMILADEPTGNLDRASGNEVVQILEELNRSGISLIMVTHDPVLGDRALRKITMDDGNVVGDITKQ
ncbi:MAG: macrolide ABC transporter ATP-binding protein [Deltaproteobacteria bacterium RBG_13_49_15]|nr:MAG: macrolide ABC transporter ATP-binding protein [Deltaproteobacteria bacterium RBG_13_49_15]